MESLVPAPADTAPSGRGVVVTSRWQVADRHTQRATADHAMARWQRLPWPEGCLSVTCLLSTDGHLVMFYSQWASEPDYRRHAANVVEGDTADRVVDHGSGITHLEATVSRLATSPSNPSGDAPHPGCIALISIATDGPELQRQAAERIAAFRADAHPGAIGGHLLFSLDGARVTLYAEWTSEEAHQEAIAGSRFGGRRGIFDGVPGVRGLSMHRYQRYRTAGR
ncbi:antibiotic biosynthesis monooxygenase family protein [Micromonospora avicenniae]|uniref:antibiotic biosynthesis monooxygenase family protein n=1 Tax=Micromonospora avicenniae TaxID=1198245 RepID=UPI00341F141B